MEEAKAYKKTNLNFLNVALMFVGAIMGAGFASGREIWQFFGVFGKQGRVGILLIAVMFVVLGMMTAYLARILGTNDMGRIIAPGGNPKIENFVSWFMAIMLFTVLINMTAAGGALLYQNFGISRLVGGVLIGVLVVLTVLGEFERISRVFRYIMPVLFAAVVLISFLAILADLGTSATGETVKPSPIAGNWILAACLYISYNILAMIPIVATSSVNAKTEKAALLGSGLGGIFLGCLAFTIVMALKRTWNSRRRWICRCWPMRGGFPRAQACFTVFCFSRPSTLRQPAIFTVSQPSFGQTKKRAVR